MTASTTDSERIALLLGGWRLLKWEIYLAERGEPVEPFGAGATGLLVYTVDGSMQVSVAARERPATFLSPRQGTTAEKAAAFETFFSYGGTYRLDGDRILHDVEICTNPALVGTRQIRKARWDAETLVLEVEKAGSCHVVTWVRAAK